MPKLDSRRRTKFGLQIRKTNSSWIAKIAGEDKAKSTSTFLRSRTFPHILDGNWRTSSILCVCTEVHRFVNYCATIEKILARTLYNQKVSALPLSVFFGHAHFRQGVFRETGLMYLGITCTSYYLTCWRRTQYHSENRSPQQQGF